MGRKVAIRLSQVMITKNEEKNIERALSWGKNIVYEQIVVDTGSTDRTVEIAKKMGATVLHFDWINDFAAAKNFALKHATGDWIAILDADEFFEESQAKRIMPEIRDAERYGCNCLIQFILNLRSDNTIQDEIQQTRIIKNRCGMHYVGAIHEHLSCKGGLKAFYPRERLTIFHTGYTSDAMQEKLDSNRNLTIIQGILEKEGDNGDMYGYLGDEYMLREKNEDAINAYKKSLELYGTPIPDGDRPLWSFGKLVNLLLVEGRADEAKAYYDIAVKRYPFDADFDYIVGKDYFRKSEFEKAVPHLERVIDILNHSEEGSGRDATAHLDLVYEMLSYAYLKTPGKLKESVRYASILLHANKKKGNVLSTFLLAFSMLDGDRDANAAVAMQGVQKMYDMSDVEDCLIVCKAAMTADYKEFIAILDRTISPENMRRMAEAVNDMTKG